MMNDPFPDPFSDDLSAEYSARRLQTETRDVDALMQRRLGTTPAPVTQTPEQIGMVREFGRGLARGTFGIGEGIGTALKAAGYVMDSQTLQSLGDSMAQHWAGLAKGVAPSAAAKGNLWENPALVLSPNWLAATVAESIPSLAVSMVPAMGAYGAAVKVGSQLLPYSPALVVKLARIGSIVTGGSIGGTLAGAQTYDIVKTRGGSDADAVKAMALFGLASAGLNAVSLSAILGPGASAAGRFGKGGLANALMNYLQAPIQSAVLGDDLAQSLKDGLNTLPASFLVGGAAAAVAGGHQGRLKEAETAFQDAVKQAEQAGRPITSEVIAQAQDAFEKAKAASTHVEEAVSKVEGLSQQAGELPTGPPSGPAEKPVTVLPAEELRVNLNRIDATEQVKNTIKAIKTIEIERQARRVESMREPVTHEKTIEESRGALTLEEALTFDPEDIRPKAQALRDHFNAAVTHVTDLAEKTLAGDAEAGWQLNTAYSIAAELALRDEMIGGRAGRLLESRKILSDAERAPLGLEAIQELSDRFHGQVDVDPKTLAARILTLRTKEQRQTMLQQIGAGMHGTQNVLYEAWINALLSGPQTHVVNFLSNTLTTLWAIPERGLAARLQIGDGPHVAAGEATAMLRGVVEGWTDGLRWAAQTWKGEDPSGPFTKLDVREPAISAGQFEGTSIGRAIDVLGSAIRIPSRLLSASDAFFKGVNYRMELKALALRDATAEGLSGKELIARIADLEANPPTRLQQKAIDFAVLQTFQNELGPGGQAIMQLANSVPGGRLVLPFIKTPTNIAKWAMQRTPGLNAFSSELRSDLLSGGVSRDLALGKIAMGALTAASVVALAGAGMITGGGPKDPDLKRQLRDTGWQPYSLKIGQTYYSYNRLDPIGAIFGILADVGELIGQLPEWQGAELALAATLSVTKNLTSKTYLQGLSTAIDAIHDPGKYGENLFRGWARSMVPTAVRTLERVLDPSLRETQSLLDEIRAGVPGWSSSLPPKRNLFGEPILLGAGMASDLINPVYTSTLKGDPVADEVARVGVDLTMPSKVLAGTRPPDFRMQAPTVREGVQLDPQTYDRLVRLAGNELKDGSGNGMKDTLAQLFRSPDYHSASDGPDGGKALMIRRIVGSFREAAKRRILDDSPDLLTQVAERKRLRADALVSPLIQSLGR